MVVVIITMQLWILWLHHHHLLLRRRRPRAFLTNFVSIARIVTKNSWVDETDEATICNDEKHLSDESSQY